MGITFEGFGRDEKPETPSLWGAMNDLRGRYGDMDDSTTRSLGGLTPGLVAWCMLAAALFVYGSVSGRILQMEGVLLPLVIVMMAVTHYVYMRRKVQAFFEHYVRSRLYVVFEGARQELRRPYPQADDYKPADWVRVNDMLRALEAEDATMIERMNALKGVDICWWMTEATGKWDTATAYSYMYSYAGSGGVLGLWYHRRKRMLDEIAAVKTLAKAA